MIDQGENLFQIGSALAQALWSGLWIGAVVAAFVFFYLQTHKGLNAASRHVAWYAALLVIAALPAVSFAFSLSRAHVETSPAAAVFSSKQPATVFAQPLLPGTGQASTSNQPALSVAPLLSPDVLEGAGVALAVALASIAVARIVVLFVGLIGLWKVKRASVKVDPSLSPTLARTMARDADARAVSLRLSDTIDAPAAAGFRSPAILLPADLVESLEPSSLDQIAMHEYAHLRRYDDWTNLFQRFVERVFWFNPAIWFVGGRIDLEREIACDDWAVEGAEGVSAYADCLWQLASNGRLPSFAATAPGAFVTRSQVAARIEHLLQRRRDGAPTLRTSRLLAVAPVLAGALALVAGRAPAIALHATAPAPAIAHVDVSRVAFVRVPMAVRVPIVVQVHEIAPGVLAAGAPKVRVIEVKTTSTSSRHCPLRTKTSTKTMTNTLARTTTSTSKTKTKIKTQTAWIQVDVPTSQVAVAAQAGVAIADQRTAIAHQVESSVQTSVATAMHVAHVDATHSIAAVAAARRAAISASIHANAPKHFTFVEAASDVTDNLSFGPNDRDLIAHCSGCDLSNKDLHNADLHGLTLTGDDLSGADLTGANLRQTVLTGVDLSNARLDRADLRGAVLTGTDISGATFEGAKTDGIRLVGMQLTDAILAGSSTRAMINACAGCDLSGLDLHGRDLHGITLDGADLHGTDLSGANLQGARFNGVDFSGVKFKGADLRGAEFNGCDLSNADLSQARTQGIEIRGSSLGGSDTTIDSNM